MDFGRRLGDMCKCRKSTRKTQGKTATHKSTGSPHGIHSASTPTRPAYPSNVQSCRRLGPIFKLEPLNTARGRTDSGLRRAAAVVKMVFEKSLTARGPRAAPRAPAVERACDWPLRRRSSARSPAGVPCSSYPCVRAFLDIMPQTQVLGSEMLDGTADCL